VKGVHGFGKYVEIGMIIVANPKAGMDTVEFEKHLNKTILPLYSEASDIPGKRLSIIVDSVPGRVNTHIFAELCIKGF